MAESVNGGSKTPAQPPKEMSMEVRLLIAFLLMGVVMFVTPYFFKSQVPPAANKAATGQTAAQGTPGVPSTPGAEPTLVIETDLYRIAFSNQGGTVRSWQLKKAKGNDHKTLDLVNSAAGGDFPYSLHFPEQKPLANVNWAWYQQTVDPDGLGVTYEFYDGHVHVRKVFRFQIGRA